MSTSFRKPNSEKKVDPLAAEKLARELADKTYDEPITHPDEEEELKPLQFKIPLSLHKEFKIYAATKEIKMVDLFKLMYKEFKQNNP